jgi:hypothetical protein
MNRKILSYSALICLISLGIGAKKGVFNQFLSNSTPMVQNARENLNHTEIYIINGDHEGTGWFEGPSKSEFMRALYEYPQHMFITPSLWKSFCHHRNEQMKELKKENIEKPFDQLTIESTNVRNTKNSKKVYSQNNPQFFNLATILVFDEDEWEFYDTHIGLYYLRPKDDLQDIGLKLDTFTKIDNPCSMNVPAEKKAWVDGFINLFDTNAWHKNHPYNKKKIVCISGHGTPRRPAQERACGIPSTEFAKLIAFFNDKLNIDTLGVQTCYWPAQRILELMANNKTPHLNCQLITPIDQEKVVNYTSEMPLVWSYEPKTKAVQVHEAITGEILLSGLHDLATSFKGTVTEDINSMLNDIQVVQVNHKYNMKTSLVDAGSTQPVFV